jgi:serine phosphatase RsbU (regulator of sigma subunit)
LLAVSRAEFDSLLGGETLAVRLMRSLAKALRALDVRFAAREEGTHGGAQALRAFSRRVNQAMLPKHIPAVEGYEIAVALTQDESGGGDAIWDIIPLPDGGTLVSVMDMKGKGLPPAYLLGVARALLRQIASSGEPFPRLLPRLNDALGENLFDGLDAYVEVGLLQFGGTAGGYGIAGDQPGISIRGPGEGLVHELSAHGPPLGILPHFDYGAARLDMEPGDLFLIFSEIDRALARGAADLVRGRRDLPAAELAQMLQSVLREVKARSGGQDVALVLVKRT